jgi:hypothetical protein
MTNLDEHGRPEPPEAAGETATLLGFLDFQRATLRWKCAGLDSASEDSPEQLMALWQDGVDRSRALVAEALAGGGLDQASRTGPSGRAPSLRWILCHMVEEYARHNGHADLIRESIDGITGE